MEYEKTLTQDEGDRLGTLERHVGSQVYQELLAVFLGDLSLQLGELRRAEAVGDVAAARYVAHQINGTAPGFGAVHLDGLADRLLLIGRDQRELLGPLVVEIDNEVSKLQAIAAS